MITIVFFVCVLFFVFLGIISTGWVEYPSDYLIAFILAFGIALGTSMLFNIPGAVLEDDPPPETSRTELIALSDAVGVEGRLFLGSGTINSQPVYLYYYRSGDGFKQDYVNASNVTVYEDQQDSAYIQFDCEPSLIVDNFIDFGSGTCYATEIHVPPNTITRDIELDLGD